MRRWLWILILPLAQGAVIQDQHVDVDTAAQATNVALLAGSLGTPNIGVSATSAAPSVTLPLLPDDILRLDATTTDWNVRAELVSQTGWSIAESITVALDDGTPETQIDITLGVVTQTVGLDVGLPTGDTLVTVAGLGSGTLSFDLVLTPPTGGLEVRYRINLSA